MGRRSRFLDRVVWTTWIVVAALFMSAAHADEQQVERRLKRIGVSKSLRDEVRTAIDRGVAYLVSQQGDDGAWVHPRGVVQANVPHGDGLNALCALALVHADTEASRLAAERATARLLPERGSVAGQLQTTTYGAGIGLMLLDMTRGSRRRMAHVAGRIAAGRDPDAGSWNYRTGTTTSIGLQAPPGPPELAGPLNLSTAQFAVLGLHAAERRAEVGSRNVWRDVLDGLLETQQADGSWTYHNHHPATRGTYTTTTYMGLASLELAARHLDALTDTRRGTTTKRRVERALRLGVEALEADAQLTLWQLRRGEGRVDGYSVWALEKACIFVERETLDGTQWYAHAARSLVDAQGADGAWTTHATADSRSGASHHTSVLWDTSFALLVLIRDMESLRAITPKDRPDPGPAITPSIRDHEPSRQPRPRLGVPIDEAHDAVGRLLALVAANDASNAEFLPLLDLLAEALDTLAPATDPARRLPSPAEIETAIREALRETLFVTGDDPGGDEEGRRPVNARAAELIETQRRADLDAVRRRLERMFKGGEASHTADDVSPYRPAFRLLARTGDEKSLRWMEEHALHDDLVGERAERTLAFLLAIPEFAELSAASRVKLCDRIGNKFAGRAAASAAVTPHVTEGDPVDRMRWSRFRPRVMEALYHLSADRRDAALPRDDRDELIVGLARFREWLRDHDNPRRPPWRAPR